MGDAGRGIAALIVACTVWGLSPLYYAQLTHIPALEILAWRAISSLVFFLGVLSVQGRLGAVGTVLVGGQVWRIGLAGVMIAANWFGFIWSVGHGAATEASLGYYIFPLVAVLIGRLVLGERLDRAQWGAVALAASAVLVLGAGLGAAPWIALALAATFGVYGLLKKQLDLGPVLSVTVEMALLLPLAVWFVTIHGTGPGRSGIDWLLLALCGPITALPLVLFSFAARRVRMVTVGLLQYINPTLQFACATLYFREPFSQWHAIAFSMIWVALAIYSVAAVRRDASARRQVARASALSTTVT